MNAAARCLKTALIPLVGAILLIGCGPVGGGSNSASSQPGIGDTVSNPTTEMYKPTPLLWENQNKDGRLWSAYTYQIIGNDVVKELLPGSDDMGAFCPNYSNMTAPQKVNFWAYLVSAIAKYASGFDPASRTLDLAQGIDLITGRPTYVEGLLQLSYQDMKSYAFCAFDWNTDKNLDLKDIARSILDPVKNLDCGIKILATQIERSKKIALSTDSFWQFLKVGSPLNKVKEIEKLTSSLPFCALNP